MSATLKKKKFSKKNKSAWRKHINVSDVDEFLEEQRQAERIGDFSIKKDEDLFTIDVQKCPKLLLSAKERRKLNAQKPAKNLTALENTSAVQDPITKRNKVKLKKHGRNILEEVTNPTSQKHKQANEDREKYYNVLDKKIETGRKRDFNKDIWENSDEELKEYGNHEWVSKDLALYHLKNTGRAHVKLPGTIRKKTTLLKPIEKPDPGVSYNPTLKDHQKLLSKVLSKEEEIMKQERHLKRVTTDMFSKVTVAERDNEKLKDMISEMGAENVDNPNSTQKCDANIYNPINPPVIVKKKAKQTRRKQKEQKEIQRNIKEKKLQQKKISDINKLKDINEEILEEEKIKDIVKKNKKIKLRQKKVEPKRLGKLKFDEPDIEFNEAKDIAGNLRNIKTENSLLVQRFKVMQKRNILPVSVDVGVRKRRKIKRFVRSSHKEIPAR
ncbi:ribosome biogenesis protein NOP53 [Condylostylus longicornis]|uniref:ribosome biogenesis protein NOP53 n=1 Tax=Condylostylus longicornis TaxID=2530218 RepID=UPI00244E431A|nr:ribosome biogenesis protein NOP53 [Condylostylus longicornis]